MADIGEKTDLRQENYSDTLVRLLLFFSILLLYYLHATALLIADDFYYATFWMDGPLAFWQRTVNHYQSFNGRVFVHFVAQTVLAFPMPVFALLNTGLLVGMGALAFYLQPGTEWKQSLPLALLLFLSQLFLLPRPVLTEGLLWVSASYNYMLPVFMTVAALSLLAAFLKRERLRVPILMSFLLLQFLAGATTEQCGFMVIVTTACYGLLWAIRAKKRRWFALIAPLCNGLGYLTIYLSPATQSRAANSASLDPETLYENLDRMGSALLSWDGLLLPLLAAAVLLGVCCALPKMRCNMGAATPALLLGGLASAAIMLPTGNFQPRTMLPLSLVLCLVSAACGARLLEALSHRWGSLAPALCGAALLVLSILLLSPMLAGIYRNYGLELRNRAAIREAQTTKILHYCMDYDTRWCYPALMYTGGSFYLDFLDAKRLTNYTVYLESAHMKRVYLNGQQTSSPGYEQDGKVFFALRDVIEGFGGTVEYDQEICIVTLDGREVRFYPMLIACYWPDGVSYVEYDLQGKSVKHYCKASYTAEVYQYLFGIHIRLDGDRYLCEKEPLT